MIFLSKLRSQQRSWISCLMVHHLLCRRPRACLLSSLVFLPFAISTLSVLQNRWRQRETSHRTHFEAHFSWGWRTHGLSQSTEFVIRKAPCLHPAKRYFDCQKTIRAGL